MEHVRYFYPDVTPRAVAMGEVGKLVGRIACSLEIGEISMVRQYAGSFFDVLNSHSDDIMSAKENTISGEDLRRLEYFKRMMRLSSNTADLIPDIDDIILNQVKVESSL